MSRLSSKQFTGRWRHGRFSHADDDAQAGPLRASVFVTVGTELPFDRLVRAVDEWAAASDRDVFAQIGRTDYQPQHIASVPFLGGADFRRLFTSADLIIAHAGMGTIIAALEQARPLLIMPRRAELGEHRNDHQLATVERLTELGLVDAVPDTGQLRRRLDDIGAIRVRSGIGGAASPALLERVRSFILAGEERQR